MSIKTKLTAIHIIFALFFISCKKELPSEPIRHEITSSRNYVVVNNVLYSTPATFFWKAGEGYLISTLGSWTGDNVRITIRKNGVKVVEKHQNGGLEFIYNVQP